MIGFEHVFGTSERLFLNTSLGCTCSCLYCYLPNINLAIGSQANKNVSSDKLIEYIENNHLYVPGKNGTLISIGCYSECWDGQNKKQTKSLLRYFISKGNPIQIASKMYIDWREIEFLTEYIRWKGQFIVFVSCATVTYWSHFEKGTCHPQKRFRSFDLVRNTGIPCCLYIKPVIKGVTVRDRYHFSRVMKEYAVPAVIGSYFSEVRRGNPAPIANSRLFYNKNVDEYYLFNYLKQYGSTYRHSHHYNNEWRIK